MSPSELVSNDPVVAQFREQVSQQRSSLCPRLCSMLKGPQILEREEYVCPVTLLRDSAGPKPKDKNVPLVTLEAAHILPLALGNTTVSEGV